MRWRLVNHGDVKASLRLAESFDMPPVIAQILVGKGLTSKDEIDDFFHPSLDKLSDPMAIPGMSKAIKRLVDALRHKERILIFGDYDVDGITATALMYDVLSSFGADVCWYLPDRLIDGYGLSPDGIDEAKKQGAKLLLSVDCGITGVEETRYALKQGIECIITDHHEPGDTLPDAVALVDPKLGDADSPVRDMAGVGVAFKIAEALYNELELDKTELYEHLDLVGLGTIADIVPLTDENRIVSRYGLRTLEATKKPGLKALLQITGLWGNELSSWHIVFVLAPRINAAGRIGNPALAFKLLTTLNPTEASEFAVLLDAENKKRKELDERIFDEAVEMVKKKVDLSRDKAIVLASDKWHIGVIGIVASRLVERFNRPAIMISTQDGEGKGSARSIGNFHILNAIKECKQYLSRYGGHKFAAGLCVAEDKIEKFKECFNNYVGRHLTDNDMIPMLDLDAQIFPAEISMELMKWLDMFAPYGPENMRPVFLMQNARLAARPQIIGQEHIRFRIHGKNDKPVDVVGFGMAEHYRQLQERKEPVNLAFVVETNSYYGYPKLQLRLKDIKFGDWRE